MAFMLGSAFDGGAVAPYGGPGRVLSTNPISFSVPAGGDPVVVDIATAVAAEGKLRFPGHGPAAASDSILDRDGNPSTDARDFYEGGMLLPFGGHKGYGLSVVADLLGRHLGWAMQLRWHGRYLLFELPVRREGGHPASAGRVPASCSGAAFPR